MTYILHFGSKTLEVEDAEYEGIAEACIEGLKFVKRKKTGELLNLNYLSRSERVGELPVVSDSDNEAVDKFMEGKR